MRGEGPLTNEDESKDDGYSPRILHLNIKVFTMRELKLKKLQPSYFGKVKEKKPAGNQNTNSDQNANADGGKGTNPAGGKAANNGKK